MKLLAVTVALALLFVRPGSPQDQDAVADPQDGFDLYQNAVDSDNTIDHQDVVGLEDAVGPEDPVSPEDPVGKLPTPELTPLPPTAPGEEATSSATSDAEDAEADTESLASEDTKASSTPSTPQSTKEETEKDASVDAQPPEPSSNRTAVDWLRAGVDAYLSENWAECTRALENAVVEWHHFRSANIGCRLRCRAEAQRAQPLFPDDVEHMHFLEEMVRATLCLIKCKRTAFQGHATGDALPEARQKAFRDLKPYEYLQLCYYQVSENQKAASAVFTILSHDPNNEIMKSNLKFYLSTGEVDDKAIVNYEAQKYVTLYLKGTEAYYLEDYGTAITNLEASIEEFLHAVEECRADCEGPFDQGWLPDFTSSIANHFVYCLKCKAKCHSKLSRLNGDKYEDFLPMHYNYLQFAYYKKGHLGKACAAAATYLMFLPADETMIENVEYYKSVPEVHTDMFQPFADAVQYVKRQAYEEALLRYISDEFVFEDTKENSPPPSEEILGLNGGQFCMRINPSQLVNDDTSPTSFKKEVFQADHLSEKELKSRLESSIGRSIFNMLIEEYLGGSNRFLVDGLADETECLNMVQFAQMGAVSGDGYEGKKSPHSSKEKFEGVTLGRAALMVHYGLIDLSTLDLFLRLSERGRNIVSAYFNVPKNDLFFSFTHLVCRSAMHGSSSNGSHYSHEIHADNCWLQKDGNCIQSYPAFYWRDYSALLYLNDDFQGGEFIFSEDPKGRHVQSAIKPTCGRFVGFTAGQENFHGVRGVKSGSRCALALWFTLDQSQAEWGRSLTEEIIPFLESGEQPTEELVVNLQKLEKFNLKEARNHMLQVTSCNLDKQKSCNFETEIEEDQRKPVSHASNSSMH